MRAIEANLASLLQTGAHEIVAEAELSMKRAHLTHYEADGEPAAHHRLRHLYYLVARGIRSRRSTEVIAYAKSLARERFYGGFDLREVQTALNVMEEAIWKAAVRDLEAVRLGEALARVSSLLGTGKDALAREWVLLASETQAQAIDCGALFRGTDGPSLPPEEPGTGTTH